MAVISLGAGQARPAGRRARWRACRCAELQHLAWRNSIVGAGGEELVLAEPADQAGGRVTSGAQVRGRPAAVLSNPADRSPGPGRADAPGRWRPSAGPASQQKLCSARRQSSTRRRSATTGTVDGDLDRVSPASAILAVEQLRMPVSACRPARGRPACKAAHSLGARRARRRSPAPARDAKRVP